MRNDWIEVSAEKAAFIAALQDALLLDQERNGLDSIYFEQDLSSEDEIITVIFKGGGTKKILATANSNAANAKEIVRAIYG